MDGPLDDALRKYDQHEAIHEQQSRRQSDEYAARRQDLNKMVRDFVRRMNQLGNPGTMTWTHDRIRRGVIAWRLGHTLSDSRSQLWVTPDGRVPGYSFEKTLLDYKYWTVLTPIEEARFSLDKQGFDDLGREMARLLRSAERAAASNAERGTSQRPPGRALTARQVRELEKLMLEESRLKVVEGEGSRALERVRRKIQRIQGR
jgi:hypothetical protein